MSRQLRLDRQGDANFDPATGAKANIYQTGTTTPVTVYQDTGLTTPHANPIVADSEGRFPQAFYGGNTALRVVFTTASDATLETLDPAPLTSISVSAASNITSSPFTGVNSTNVQDALEEIQQNISPGDVVYELDTVPNLLADQVAGYDASDDIQVAAGDLIYAGGFRYEVAASTATDQDLTTTGGVKLNVLPTDQGENVLAYGARGNWNGTTGTDDTAAIRAALATGRKVFFPKGRYLISGELEVVTPGQVIEFETTGGYAYGEDIGANWVHGTQIVVNTTITPRIRTRRLFRGSVGDPQDAALSVALNIQAENVVLDKVAIWLECDYTDSSPTNFGADCDVGIFIGTRVGCQFHDIQVIGYFRQAGVYLDVTNGTDLARFNDLSGSPYPTGTVQNGADGFRMTNPYIRGARRGFAVLGARPKSGETDYSDAYYDEALGATVTDRRGSFGSSDLLVEQGRIYGPDHHSDRRLKDPELNGGVVNETSMGNEPDDAPCAVQIDGLAGNASSNIWGMRFLGVRMATFEAFRVRLDKASRVSFIGSHIEGRNSSRLDTSGASINTNDYTATSYGDVAGTSETSHVTIFGTHRQSYADGAAPHFYGSEGAPFMVTDSGRVFIAQYLEGEADLDLRAASGSLVRFREGNNSVMTASSTAIDSFGAEYRSTGGATFEVTDDAVISLTPPSLGGTLVLTCMGTGGTFPDESRSGLIFYDTGGSLSIRAQAAGSSLDVQTADVTGTTGTNGNVTVAARPGTVKIENRSGSTQRFKFAWLA